jgi:hypothetical protein
VFKALIAFGNSRKFVAKDYKVYGLKQSPNDGKSMFQKLSEMNQWQGFINV